MCVCLCVSVFSLRVGQAIGQVEHVQLLVCDSPQALVDILVKDKMARGARQGSLTRS